ncbi:response regulator [Pseudobdellovibrio exovorus]|uniref:Sensory/regulatory protein RpfC n=1 Tax=Pseudobdellovibrio exovorus JSS TaxID=1184267 RepID=M4VDU0_9BACT|nr:response regulator [Pseudobdellovibrio exovorus]AGH96655.1 hypothetical protein A11Q_2439 [Pseudobdellovibrio exovorus JSS]
MIFKSSSKNKILLLYVAGSFLLFIIFCFALIALNNYRVDTAALIDRYEFAKSLTDIDRMQKDAEISQLGFLLTNKRRYLAPYTEVDSQIWSNIEGLKKNGGTPAREQISLYEDSLKKKFNYMKESVSLRDEGLTDPLQVIFTGVGRRTSADLEVSYSNLLDDIKSDLDRAQQNAKKAAGSAEKLFYQVGILAFVIFTLAMWGVFRDARLRERHEEELLRAREMAVQASEFKTQFLSMMSHEVRTPLNAIIGMSELLEETPLNDKQKNYVGVFRKSGDMLLRIVNDILDLSKIEAGEMQLEPSWVELSVWLDEIQQMMLPRAEQKKIELVFENQLPVGLICQMDGNRLRQVVINLIGNAIKFTDKGEVRLQIMRPKSDQLCLVVADTGLGMTTAQMKRIFKPFQQADVSTARQYGGTGLGLFISKKILNLANATIHVESELGKRSRFTVVMPTVFKAQDVTAKPAPAAAAVDIEHFRQKSILIVDDVEDNRQLIQHYLAPAGMQITSGSDGQQALNLFEQQSFDVILMDMQMPVMNGSEAVQKIRQLEKEKKLRPTVIVALTAQAYESEREMCLKIGCNLYLSKPFKKKDLFSILDQAIRAKDNYEKQHISSQNS